MRKISKKAFVLFYSAAVVTVLCVNSVIAIEVVVDNPIETGDFAKIIENTLLWVLGIAGSIALFMLIVGGIMYITSGGDEQKVATAKKMFNFTVLGLIIVLLSYSIIKALNDILGLS